MVRTIPLAVLWWLTALSLSLYGQPKVNLDSLRQLLPQVDDSTRFEILIRISEEIPSDSALLYADQAQQVAIKLGYKAGVARSLRAFGDYHYAQAQFQNALEYYDKARLIYESDQNISGLAEILKRMAFIQRAQGRYAEALDYAFQAHKHYETLGDKRSIGDMLRFIGYVYNDQENDKSALEYFRRALKVAEDLGDEQNIAVALRSLSEILDRQGNNAQALEYAARSLAIMQEIGDAWDIATSNRYLGRVYHNRRDYKTALEYYQKALAAFEKLGDKQSEVNTRRYMAETYLAQKRYELAAAQAEKGYEIADEIGMQRGLKETARVLADIYDAQGNARRALLFYRKYVEMKDLLLSSEVQSNIANLQTKIAVEEKAQRIKALELEKSRQNLIRNSLLGGSFLLLVIVLLIASSYRAKQRQNLQLQATLKQLRETQAQLIYAEKMASAGQLATRMAHELQNPLNFVSNFAELSKERCESLMQELDALNLEPEKKKALLPAVSDLLRHSEKILYHGERAAKIVHSLLEYANLHAAEKVETDLESLISEALKAVSGAWQRTNPHFQVKLTLQHDRSIGKVLLSPQEMSRALSHLFSNSFYAMQEKWQSGLPNYQPELRVQTHRQNGTVEIRIWDNGTGIASAIREKVFLPFFTTKPSVSGSTGLGLAICYEIIKGHNGEITFESSPNEWTEFIVKLPIKQPEPLAQ
ncbi:MAG: tetratricopeptide repeat-containing sensor histidine kinase [Chloroherpetonaceae bacterium]|nr:tetratricopeptide repeat-containing sensor histidine kinase [Chloroherpetonaceae bacterium]MCS7212250.1 tetratricopeptide repeat-containing sensor histidine kinase [Chloroherpetonaceae bacterium]MDW8018831.1 tetratricopeptide repeat-containing sensor histidine kinase [Chloroherpetonaceae bacterium]